MTNSVYYTPTEDERAAIEYAGMVAAYDVLKSLDMHGRMSSGTLVCMRAISAARRAISSAEDELLKMRSELKGARVETDINACHVMCTALLSIASGDDLPIDEYNPRGVGGWVISVMINACIVLDRMESLQSAFDCDEPSFADYMSSEAEYFVAKFVDEYARLHGDKQ